MVAAKLRAPRRRWPISEKRRIVELTLREGTSIGAVANEQGVHPTSLSHWRALYHAGKLDPRSLSHARARSTPSAAFLPVTITPTVQAPEVPPGLRNRSVGVIELTLSSGSTLRIETDALETVVRALVAELHR
ncbi:MAG: IS66-like element accessory protein TnpA [Vulcanimicrobiaceae bacterium]